MEPKLTIRPDGRKVWLLNGEYHREDGPAIEHLNGTKIWCLNGRLHRKDGPAEERPNGSKFWYINGEYHRENGPAIEYSNGSKYWYLNGRQLFEEELLSKGIQKNYPDLHKSYLIHEVMDS